MFKVYEMLEEEFMEFELEVIQICQRKENLKWHLIVNPINRNYKKSYGDWNQNTIVKLINITQVKYIETMLKEYNGYLTSNYIVYFKSEEDAQRALDWITGQVIIEKLCR